jgi:hypothetical protein
MPVFVCAHCVVFVCAHCVCAHCVCAHCVCAHCVCAHCVCSSQAVAIRRSSSLSLSLSFSLSLSLNIWICVCIRVRAHWQVHVGDDLVSDVGGAHRLGMRTVWFNGQHSSLLPPVSSLSLSLLSLSSLSLSLFLSLCPRFLLLALCAAPTHAREGKDDACAPVGHGHSFTNANPWLS